jgi:hypothetical protein
MVALQAEVARASAEEDFDKVAQLAVELKKLKEFAARDDLVNKMGELKDQMATANMEEDFETLAALATELKALKEQVAEAPAAAVDKTAKAAVGKSAKGSKKNRAAPAPAPTKAAPAPAPENLASACAAPEDAPMTVVLSKAQKKAARAQKEQAAGAVGGRGGRGKVSAQGRPVPPPVPPPVPAGVVGVVPLEITSSPTGPEPNPEQQQQQQEQQQQQQQEAKAKQGKGKKKNKKKKAQPMPPPPPNRPEGDWPADLLCAPEEEEEKGEQDFPVAVCAGTAPVADPFPGCQLTREEMQMLVEKSRGALRPGGDSEEQVAGAMQVCELPG